MVINQLLTGMILQVGKLPVSTHQVKKLFQTMDFSGDGAINLQDADSPVSLLRGF